MYKLGAIPNKRDVRDIPVGAVQSPVIVPDAFKTDISMIPILNQNALGACVGHAHAVIHAYLEYKETGSVKLFSPRYLYALSKRIDGLATEGTYPRVANRIMQKNGCALTDTVPNDTTLSHNEYINIKDTVKVTKQASIYKTKGYADVSPTKEAIKQALYQNGVIAMSICVGDYNYAPMAKGDIGQHRVVAYGYQTVGNDLKILCRNSWGEQWGDKGNFYIMFNTFKDGIFDINVYVDIPNEILEEYKKVDVTITRSKSTKKQTLGKLVAKRNGATFTCDTLELPDLQNAPNISCVPKGTYDVSYTRSGLFKKSTYELLKVPNRSGIRLHSGNYAWKKDGKGDIQGCILLGSGFSDINKDNNEDIINSRLTINAFEQFMGKTSFKLLIK
jgi:hypothetical protein